MNGHECQYHLDGGSCLVCGKTVIEQLDESKEEKEKPMPSGDPMWRCQYCGREYYTNIQNTCFCEDNGKFGLVARERRPYGFPVSRDWEEVDCKAIGCRFNRNEKCMTPSICKIGDDGRCINFQMKPMQVGKPDGD